jgi:hypothetical protein
MDRAHEIGRLLFEDDCIHVQIDGREHVFDLREISSRLLQSSAEQRGQYEISPSGDGIHGPLIDEDLSIDGLLGITRSHPEQAGERRSDKRALPQLG